MHISTCPDMEDDNSFSLPKKRNIFSSRFQYSERTKATTETKNTSKESSETQLIGARQIKVWHYQGGTTRERKFTIKLCS
jgi:hypothetical protein